MDPKAQLLGLVKIQELALEIRSARIVVDGAPGRIEEIESRFRERNAEYVALQERFDALDKDQRSRTQDMAALEESRKKYTEQLMQVKNQREYAAALKELDSVKAQIGEHEDRILKDMEEIESLRGDLEARASHIGEERTRVAAEVAQVEGDAVASREKIDRLVAERGETEAKLPRALVSTLHRVEEARQGLFLAKAEDGICQACFVRIRPQVFQEIKLASSIHSCGNCHRFLYYEPALRQAATGSETEDSGLEAANGG